VHLGEQGQKVRAKDATACMLVVVLAAGVLWAASEYV
jgi:hypothetical protein